MMWRVTRGGNGAMALMNSSQSSKALLLSRSKLCTNMTRPLFGSILKFARLN
jgi:hypothetical protein